MTGQSMPTMAMAAAVLIAGEIGSNARQVLPIAPAPWPDQDNAV